MAALVASIAGAAIVPMSNRTGAIEGGDRSDGAPPRTSDRIVAYTPGAIHIPSLARLSRNGAPVPEMMMVGALRALGLDAVVVPVASSRPLGTILYTAPTPSVGVAPGSTVSVVVSDGRAATTLP